MVGPVIEAELPGATSGRLCRIGTDLAEIVGFRGRKALLMPLDRIDGVSYGAVVECLDTTLTAPVGADLIGRVVDGLGEPLDDGPSLEHCPRKRVVAEAPNPMQRNLVTDPILTGIRAIDGLCTLGRGQRISITSGSGVGKSTLLGMLARHVEAEVIVICLVGERGREVREFVEANLGPEGLARSVVVIATSDRSPALQVKAPLVATTIAESFRDEGKDVLLLVDSLTRLALAQRQIGLAAGEPPTTRGFTPSVFAILPPLLERAGPGTGDGGSITAIYTVLVEGDDHNDPIADAVRGIVDGHLVLSRSLADIGHYPPIQILGSLSRLMTRIAAPDHISNANRLRRQLAVWRENEELIRLGAYRAGTDPEIDEAIARYPAITAFLRQPPEERTDIDTTLGALSEVC
jgi:FliI/YscN family ATPase